MSAEGESLKTAGDDTTRTFLGNTSLQRKDIESITFVSGISGANNTKWDVSAAGDGSIMAWYTGSGPYQVSIGCEGAIFANPNSSYLFSYIGYGATTQSNTIVGLRLLNTTRVTDMNHMFYYCGYTAMTGLDLGDKFNTSKVTNMSYMFARCGFTAMTSLDLGDNFDTSQVEYMDNMFDRCGNTLMTELILGDKFDTTSVESMSWMFNRCGYGKLETLDLRASESATEEQKEKKFNTSAVKNMEGMFSYCGFTSMDTLILGDNFDTSEVEYMASMFSNCGFTAMTSLDLGDSFDTSKVKDMSWMFNKCGQTKMDALDLGPAFKIATTNSEFVTNTGTEGCIIYAPEAIYSNETTFKPSISYTTTNGKINPIYRPEWIYESNTAPDTTIANPTMEVTLKGQAYKDETIGDIKINYSSPTTVILTTSDITAYMEAKKGEYQEVTGLVQNVDGNKIILSNFEKTARDNGIKEWSGNIKLVISSGTLQDTLYGNKNLGEEIIKESPDDRNADNYLFSDVIKPYIKYEYATDTIIGSGPSGDQKVKVGFDIIDEYFASSISTDADKITQMQNAIIITLLDTNTMITDSDITKTLSKVGDVEDSEENKIGERFELLIENLDRGQGFDYSGPMSVTFPSGILTDKSSNTNDTTTLTIRIEATEIVDVVKPIWKAENVTTIQDANGKTSVTMDLIATDKYFNKVLAEALDENNDGTPEKTAEQVLSEQIQVVDADNIAINAPNLDINLSESTAIDNGVKYTLTISNFEESEESFATAISSGRIYREYSGDVKIILPEGTIEDTSGNTNEALLIELGKIDTLKPEIMKVSSKNIINTDNIQNSTQEIIFNVTDKYFDIDSQLTTDKIEVYVDNELVEANKTLSYNTRDEDEVIGNITYKSNGEIWTKINEVDCLIGVQYKLVLSNFRKERTTTTEKYTNWSGTVSIKIKPNAITDTNFPDANGNAEKEIVGEFADFIRPDVTYKYFGTSRDTTPSTDPLPDINYTDKTFKMEIDVTDKYYSNGQLTLDDFNIKISSGEFDSEGNVIIKDLKQLLGSESITLATPEEIKIQNIKMTNTTTGQIETVSEKVIGHKYILTLSDLEKLKVENGQDTADYSGVVTVTINENKVFDGITKGQKADGTTIEVSNGNISKAITSGVEIPDETGTEVVVDVVDPIWQKESAIVDFETETAQVTLKGTDTYFASSSLVDSNIELYAITMQEIDGEEVAIGTKVESATIEVTEGPIELTPQTRLQNNEIVTVQYGVKYEVNIEGIPVDAEQLKIRIASGTLTDESGNVNKVTELKLFSTLKVAKDSNGNYENSATSGFLGNTTIQRQNIENVTFVSNLPSDENTTKWDVSEAQDGSIMAWYETTETGSLKVYIGSTEPIFANKDSSYLFSYIGFGENCTSSGAAETITNISALNTVNVRNMSYMFNYCGARSMTTLDLGNNFSTRKVENMSGMFNGCGQNVMTELNLGTKFDTNKAKDMSNMFNGCGKVSLTTFSLGDKFNTSIVENMNGMFQEFAQQSTSMTELVLGNQFYTNTVTDMTNMFNGCGTAGMTSIDLGPAFANIPTTNSGFATNFGASEAIINTGEGIYLNKNAFKLNTNSTEEISIDTTKKINPKYRPIWTKTDSYINGETLVVKVEGTVNNYYAEDTIKTVINNLTQDSNLKIRVNGDERADEITATITEITTNTETATAKITLSGFETGKIDSNLYSEWSGNIALQLLKGTLIDKYGNSNLAETDQSGIMQIIEIKDDLGEDSDGDEELDEGEDINGDGALNKYLDRNVASGKMFADFIKPEFTYLNSETTIDYAKDKKTLTVVFYVADKHLNTTDTTLTLDSFYNLEGKTGSDLPTNKPIFLVDGKSININVAGNTLTSEEIEETRTINGEFEIAQVGRKYTLVVKNLPRTTGEPYYDYSGPVSIVIPENTFTDKSGNVNEGKTISIVGNTQDGFGTTDVVDVVDPIWKVVGEVDKTIDPTTGKITAIIDLQVTDKYFDKIIESDLSKLAQQIELWIDGKLDGDTNGNGQLDNGETPKITRVLTKVQDLNETRDYVLVKQGINYKIETSNGATVKYGEHYKLTLSGFEESDSIFFGERAKYNVDSSTGRVYREYSGTMNLVMPENTVIDKLGNQNIDLEIPLDYVDTLAPEIIKVSANTNSSGKKHTIVFDIVDKYLTSSSINGTALNADGTINNLTNVDTSKIHVYVDQEEATTITKTITNIQVLKATVNGDANHIVGYRYTLELTDFEQTRTSINTARHFIDWSGTVSIKIDAGVATDAKGISNKETELKGIENNQTSQGDFVDFIKPDITYQYLESSQETPGDINYQDKTFTMVFDITDKYFDESTLTTAIQNINAQEITEAEKKTQRRAVIEKYLTVTIAGVDITTNRNVDIDITSITNILADTSVSATNRTPIKKTVDGAVVTLDGTNSDLEQYRIVGNRYTLKISGLEQAVKTGEFLDYSGVITVVVKNQTTEGSKTAIDTTGNTSATTSITSGVDIPGGDSSDEVIVDVVDPFWEQAELPVAKPSEGTASVKVKITDKYFTATNLQAGGLLPSNITVYVNGEAVTSGITVAVQEDTSVTINNGKQYKIDIAGYSSDAYQLSIKIAAGLFEDADRNKNKEQEIPIFDSLKQETSVDTKFLGKVIEREKIEQIIFIDSFDGMNEADEKWDVSISNNGSIMAWYKQTDEQKTKGTYTIYIGSPILINGNENSSYLFANIGSNSNCKVTGNTADNPIIKNIELLHVDKVSNMSHMFENCGSANMKSFDLDDDFDTGNATDMSYMFAGCGSSAMTSLDLGTQFDTSSATNMNSMFAGCGASEMTSLDLGDLFYTTANVTDMTNMFNGCGSSKMAVLDLGPRFTNIAAANEGFATNCGESGAVIYAPEAIYSNKNSFKLNASATEGAESYTKGTINPIYKPEWTKVESKLYQATDASNPVPGKITMTIKVKGNANKVGTPVSQINYISDIVHSVDTNKITVYIDGEQADSITKAVNVTTESASEVQYTITLSGFEEETRTTNAEGKIRPFKEWSGNVSLQFDKGTLVDDFGNQNMAVIDTTDDGRLEVEHTTKLDANTSEPVDSSVEANMFADLIKPEFTYKYSVSDINHGEPNADEYVKVVFDVVDKYFTNSVLSKDDITIAMIGAETNVNTDVQKNLVLKTIAADVTDETTGVIYKQNGDIYYNNKRIGQRYELTITNLDRGLGFDYSGPMSITIPAGALNANGTLKVGVIDNSGNLNPATTITIGINEEDGNANTDGDANGQIVDVVDPIWKVENVRTNVGTKPEESTVTMDLIATDKYYLSNTLTPENVASKVKVEVDGVDVSDTGYVTRSLSAPTTVANGVKYTLTLSNWVGTNKTFTDSNSVSRQYREYSGTTKITVAKDTITDQYTNNSNEQTFELGHIDFLRPEIGNVSSTKGTNTETIVFAVTDKYFDADEEITLEEITVFIDDEEVEEISELTDASSLTHTEIKEGATVVGHQYTLVLKNFEKARNAKGYKDWSGTVRIEIDTNAIADKQITSTLANGQTITSGGNVILGDEITGAYDDIKTINGDFIDFIKPELQYRHQLTDIDKTDPNEKKYTMTFDITDKYYKSGVLTPQDILDGNIVILMQNGQVEVELDANGEPVLDANGKTIPKLDGEGKEIPIVYNLKNEPVSIVLSSTPKYATNVNVTNASTGVIETIASHQIGHTYTLTISNLDQLERKTGLTTADYSGVITVAIPEGELNEDGTIKVGVVDREGNLNVAKTITTGVDIPGGTFPENAKVIDVVDPIWERVSSSALAKQPSDAVDIEAKTGTATITFRGTDSYFANSTLAKADIEVYVNESKVTSGLTTTLTEAEALNEERIDFGTNTVRTKQYGVEYTFTVSGWVQNANQVKIRIPAGKLTDEYENSNKQTDLILYNALVYAGDENTQTSDFLIKNEDTNIQRQNIEKIIFESSIDGATAEGVTKAWDVSAQKDGSIKAWYRADETRSVNSTSIYTVHIGSDYEIFANQDSRALFAYIASGANCTSAATTVKVIDNINLLNTSSVTSMDYMFAYTGKTSMTELKLGDNFDTNNVTDMHNMFFNCGYNAMKTLDLGTKFDTRNVTVIYGMFYNCGYTAMTSLDLGDKFNTSKVSDMSQMFYQCGNKVMETIDFGNSFNTSNVTNMHQMFFGCGEGSEAKNPDGTYKGLKSLDLSIFDTSNVTNMHQMFRHCGRYALETLNLGPNFDTSSVEDMTEMFYYVARNSPLEVLDLGNKFDTSNVKSMNSMFYRTGNASMKKLDLGESFNTSKVEDMYRMFYNCGVDKMTSLDLGDLFYTTSVTNMAEMFYGCGTGKMTVLDLGPAFTKVHETAMADEASSRQAFMKDCGTSTLVIYAPESIYADRNSFK